MVVTAHGDYTPVAEIMATANKVCPDVIYLAPMIKIFRWIQKSVTSDLVIASL